MNNNVVSLTDREVLQVLDLSSNATGIYVTEDIIIRSANDALLRFWNKDKSVIGKKLEEALPELEGQPFIDILKNVWRTGISYGASEAAASFMVDGKMQTSYFDFEYKAIKKDNGEMMAILNTAIDVTERVKNRDLLKQTKEQQEALKREQELNEKLATINEELKATNEALHKVQDELYTLNKELEDRIALRTKALAQSEENFRSIIMQSPVPMGFFTGEEMKLEVINDAFLALWNRKRDIVGKPILSALPEMKDQPYYAIMQKVLQTGEPYYGNEEKVILYRNGTMQEGYYNFINHPFKDAQGNNTGVIVVATEITAQVLAQQSQQALNEELAAINEELSSTNDELNDTQLYLEETISKLEESEARLTRFFMQAPAGICVLDGPELCFELVNHSYQQLFPGRDLLGKPLLEAVPEVKGQPIWDILQNVYTTGKTFEGNGLLIPLASYDGGPVEDRYFNFIYQARLDAKGIVDGILVFVFEVTEQIITAKKVEQAEELLNAAVTAANIGTWNINLTTMELTSSERFRELYGFRADEMITIDHVLRQIPEEYRQLTSSAIEYTISSGDRYNMEHTVIGFHDKETRWVKAVGDVKKDKNGNSAYFYGVSIDITEQKKDEQRKNDFIAMVSHELKTPLTTLKAYAQVMQIKAGKNKDAFTTDALSKVEKQVVRMTTMINGFLNVSRLESGKMLIDKTRFDMAVLIKESEEETKSLYNTHRIVFHPVETTYVYADKDKIAQVINNLISNAVKYSPANTLINVACVKVDNMAQLSVQDEGIGIQEEDKEKLFERYYRVKNNATKSVSGFGIGLYLSAEIIHRHDGKIWVESEVDKGSTFYFSLPTVE